jgi:adenylosuccinate lyase
MGRIWSDQRKYEAWLQVETAAVEAMARAGIVPTAAARDIRERGRFDIARIDEIEQVTQHDVIAFTTAVAEHVGPSARWLHFGLTSSDVIDTAQALQMRDGGIDVGNDLVHGFASFKAFPHDHRRLVQLIIFLRVQVYEYSFTAVKIRNHYVLAWFQIHYRCLFCSSC